MCSESYNKKCNLKHKNRHSFFFLFEYSSHILFVTLMNGLNYSGSLLDFGNGFKLERKYSWSKLNWSLKQPSQGVGDNLHERGLSKRLEINFDLMFFFFFNPHLILHLFQCEIVSLWFPFCPTQAQFDLGLQISNFPHNFVLGSCRSHFPSNIYFTAPLFSNGLLDTLRSPSITSISVWMSPAPIFLY